MSKPPHKTIQTCARTDCQVQLIGHCFEWAVSQVDTDSPQNLTQITYCTRNCAELDGNA